MTCQPIRRVSIVVLILQGLRSSCRTRQGLVFLRAPAGDTLRARTAVPSRPRRNPPCVPSPRFPALHHAQRREKAAPSPAALSARREPPPTPPTPTASPTARRPAFGRMTISTSRSRRVRKRSSRSDEKRASLKCLSSERCGCGMPSSAATFVCVSPNSADQLVELQSPDACAARAPPAREPQVTKDAAAPRLDDFSSLAHSAPRSRLVRPAIAGGSGRHRLLAVFLPVGDFF